MPDFSLQDLRLQTYLTLLHEHPDIAIYTELYISHVKTLQQIHKDGDDLLDEFINHFHNRKYVEERILEVINNGV